MSNIDHAIGNTIDAIAQWVSDDDTVYRAEQAAAVLEKLVNAKHILGLLSGLAVNSGTLQD